MKANYTKQDIENYIKRIQVINKIIATINHRDFANSSGLKSMIETLTKEDGTNLYELQILDCFDKVKPPAKNLLNIIDKTSITEEIYKESIAQTTANLQIKLESLSTTTENYIEKAFEDRASQIYDEILQEFHQSPKKGSGEHTHYHNSKVKHVYRVLDKHFREIGISVGNNPEIDNISQFQNYKLSEKIVDNLEKRKLNVTTLLDSLRDLLDKVLGTNLVLRNDKSQSSTIKDQMAEQAKAKFTEKYNSAVKNLLTPSL